MKKSLKGASLVEALVASVIFLTVFFIAMSSMTDIARVNLSGASPVDMEEAVRQCLESFAAGTADKASYAYMWGDNCKVGRQSRFGRNLPPAERIHPENLAIACHTLEEHPATETSD